MHEAAMQDAMLEAARQGAVRHGNAMEAAGMHLNSCGASTNGTGHRPVQSSTFLWEKARRPGHEAARQDARHDAARQDEAARARWSAASVYVQCLEAEQDAGQEAARQDARHEDDGPAASSMMQPGMMQPGKIQAGRMQGRRQPGRMQPGTRQGR